MSIVRICFIVDQYGWAWDISSRELLASSHKLQGDVYSIHDFLIRKPDMSHYDFILLYPWDNKKITTELKRHAAKVVVCVAGGDQIRLARLNQFVANCGCFGMIGACNLNLLSVFRDEFPRCQVLWLTHGVDTALFRPGKYKKRKKFTVGFVGRKDLPNKRYQLAKKICKRVKVNLVDSSFFGDNKSTYRKHDKMPDFYRNIDCLLITSDFEAHPMVAYEAMAIGKPVIARRVGDLNDSILNGVSGFLVDNDEEFLEPLRVLKNNPGLCRAMGKAARQCIVQRWSWGHIAKQYEALSKLNGGLRK